MADSSNPNAANTNATSTNATNSNPKDDHPNPNRPPNVSTSSSSSTGISPPHHSQNNNNSPPLVKRKAPPPQGSNPNPNPMMGGGAGGGGGGGRPAAGPLALCVLFSRFLSAIWMFKLTVYFLSFCLTGFRLFHLESSSSSAAAAPAGSRHRFSGIHPFIHPSVLDYCSCFASLLAARVFSGRLILTLILFIVSGAICAFLLFICPVLLCTGQCCVLMAELAPFVPLPRRPSFGHHVAYRRLVSCYYYLFDPPLPCCAVLNPRHSLTSPPVIPSFLPP